MSDTLERLVLDVVAETGAAAPDLLADDSPALALTEPEEEDGAGPLYLVGLIGGKDVGKSSLINALAGLPISAASAAGPGTDRAIAYAHRSATGELQRILAEALPGRFEVVEHDHVALARQVLVDLPDIDSVYADHVETTRRALRHMLFPVWVQSVEKYADARPQQLLSRVAEGNDPRNFLFVVNKVDLVAEREGPGAVSELCADYAERARRTLGLEAAPAVFAVSAARPGAFDLPRLRALLSRQRSGDEVKQSRQLATARRQRTLTSWLDAQDLPGRAERSRRAYEQARERVLERVVTPVVETALPRLLDDPAHRAALAAPVVRQRLGRWPVVSAIDAVLSPLLSAAARGVSGGVAGGAAAPIDAVLDASAGGAMSTRIATTFAHLRATVPPLADLYGERRLWDEPAARAAAADLRLRLSVTAEKQKAVLLERAGGRAGVLAPTVRWTLTLGAMAWFPFVQPVLHAVLSAVSISTWTDAARLVVEVLGATHLLKASAFLLIWFTALWVLLRWGAGARAERLLNRWREQDGDDPELSMASQVIEWSDDLLAPLRREGERAAALADRALALGAGAAPARRDAA